jgi:hypothetical protein
MNMKHYKKPNNAIYAFELDGSQDHLITADMAPITNAEVAALTAPTAEQQQAAIQVRLEGAVQRHIDGAANALGYDSAFTAATYADEPAVPKFQNEGKAIRAWRSQVWAACYEQLVKAKATGVIPTEAELIGSLPIFKASP